jgi:hypothetical protein
VCVVASSRLPPPTLSTFFLRLHPLLFLTYSTMCEKRMDRFGKSLWAFQDEEEERTRSLIDYPCTLQATADKGLGLYSRTDTDSTGISPGTAVITEPSFACLPIGKHRARVCMKCLQFGHKKVKVSADCPDIFFCSHKCLHAMDDFTTQCGPLVTQVGLHFIHKISSLSLFLPYLYICFIE